MTGIILVSIGWTLSTVWSLYSVGKGIGKITAADLFMAVVAGPFICIPLYLIMNEREEIVLWRKK